MRNEIVWLKMRFYIQYYRTLNIISDITDRLIVANAFDLWDSSSHTRV